jgi:chromosome segregation ATPase
MMEKGSFHTSPEANPTAITDELVKNIPLPNQMPRGVNFRDIPASAMKSSTLESLISQNEDLMARLSVSLRKANQFEEKAAVLEKENQGFRAKFETLHEQFQILHEKDRIFSSRSQQLLEENGEAKEHRHKLEKVYSELYVQATALQRRLQYLERYRVRVQKASPAIQARAKRLAPVEAEFEQTRKTLSMSHMQSVNSYEAKLADCRHEIDTLKSKAAERDQLFDEKVKLHNQLVFEQRQHGLLRDDNANTIERLERENSDIRLQLKQALVIQESQKNELIELKIRLPALEEQNKVLLEQVESLQALWAHKQRETDQLEEKNRSLQKLNQTLSVNLNQQRKDMQTLQSEADAERFQATDRIKILTSEIEMLRAQTIDT